MKLLHVITGLPKAAGTSVFCAELCNGLLAAGHEVTLAVVDSKEKDCYPLDSRIKLISISSILITNHQPVTTSHYDLVHIHTIWPPVLHKVSMWAKRNNLPVVWSPHGMLTPWAMNNKKWKKLIGWWLYQRWDLVSADLLHATAKTEAMDFRHLGLKNKIVVAPLGVALRNSDGRVGGKPKDTHVVLFVSRVQKKKGLLNLAGAWAGLPIEMRKGWQVRIVGPDQENHLTEVMSECRRLGIVKDWDFLGPKYGDELQKEYVQADLFVLPTYSENFGSVVIEALANRLPVICTKGAPWGELETAKCGRWIEIGVDPLAEALGEMMSLSDDERRQMGANGRRLVEEKYTWAAVVKEMVKGYEGVVSG